MYIPDIQKMKFYLPHVEILVTHRFGKEFHKAFKCRVFYRDVKFHYDYADHLVANFSNQI